MCGGITQNMNKDNRNETDFMERARESAERKWLDWGAKNGWPKVILRKWDYVVEAGEKEWRKYIAKSSLDRIEGSLRLLEYEDW